MGTIQKTVNLAKAIFGRKQKESVYKGRHERKKSERHESKKEKRNDGSFKHSSKYSNGGLQSVSASFSSIYFPQRKKLKGYQRNPKTGKKVA